MEIKIISDHELDFLLKLPSEEDMEVAAMVSEINNSIIQASLHEGRLPETGDELEPLLVMGGVPSKTVQKKIKQLCREAGWEVNFAQAEINEELEGCVLTIKKVSQTQVIPGVE